MAEFYKKNDDGEFVEVDQDKDEDLNELWRKKSDDIVRGRLRDTKAKMRKEVEEEMAANIPESVTKAAREGVEKEYKAKLEAAESENRKLGIQLRRKAIAAEYGFKPEVEKFLGDGDEDEMRKEADTLKVSFEAAAGSKKSHGGVEKTTKSSNSENSFVRLTAEE